MPPPPTVSSPTDAHRRLIPSALAVLSDEQPCALFYDMDLLRSTFESIIRAFPPSANCAMAMKANALVACLAVARDLGMGCEVASPAELEHALRIGFPPAKIVFDSPAKTWRELRRALSMGVHLNADNVEELRRIDAILAADFGGGGARGTGRCTCQIGVRVNPQEGEGTIASSSTMAKTSKFGVPLLEARAELLDCFAEYAWLTGVHCHVGSQGCALELLVQGAKALVDLAEQVNAHVGRGQVRRLPRPQPMHLPRTSRAPRVTSCDLAHDLA